MLLMALRDLWRNPITRYGFLLFAALLLFSAVYRARFFFLDTVEALGGFKEFDRPETYGYKPYGFREQPDKATRFLHQALRDISGLALSTYQIKPTDKKFRFRIEHNRTWQELTDESRRTAMYQLFSDLSSQCPSVTGTDSAREFFEAQAQIQALADIRDKQGNPVAGKKPVLRNQARLRQKLMDIDETKIFPVLRYKPDSITALTLRELVRRAACLPDRSALWWERAVHYREYKEEQTIYMSYEKGKEPLPEMIYKTALFRLYRDKEYLFLLRESQKRKQAWSGNIDELRDENFRTFTITGDKYYLLEYVRLSGLKAGELSREEAKIIYDTLYHLNIRDLEKEYTYLMALAETAWRSGMEEAAIGYADMILSQKIYRTEGERREAYRLLFNWKLSGSVNPPPE